jgi:hypothetical protein
VTIPLRELLAQFEGAAPKIKRTAREDDSGLIDLASLAAQAKESAPAPVLAHAPIFPFGAPEPAPQPVAAPIAQEPSKAAATPRKGAWIAAACALVGAAAIAGGVNAATGASGKAQALVTGLAPFAEQGALVARAATPPEPVASKEKPAEPEAKPNDRTPAHRGPVASIGPNRPRGPVAKNGDEVVKKDPPAKPKDPCNGDLMCAMRRATGK